jgi:hypothetical protein
MGCCQNKYVKLTMLTLLLVLCLPRVSAHLIDDQLKHLSLEEKASLRHFFATAIKKDHLGHVLFFPNKPACIAVGSIKGKRSLEQKLFIKGWNVWKAKEHLFSHPNFIIYDARVKLGDSEEVLHIYFINKKTLLTQLSGQEESFKKIFVEKLSQEAFVENLKQKNTHPLIEEDQALIGVLLGYGIESSIAYKQYIGTARIKYTEQNEAERKKALTKLKVIFCAHEGKINMRTLPKASLCTLIGKTNVHPIAFMGDPHADEVKTLKEKYADELEKIEDIYQEKDLLKICLRALSSA